MVVSSSPSLVLELNSKITVQLLDVTSPSALPVIIGQQSMLVSPGAGATMLKTLRCSLHRQNNQLHRLQQSQQSQQLHSTASLNSPTSFPIQFQVWFNPTRIQRDRVYALSANVVNSVQRLEFVTTQRVPVLTNGAPSNNVVVTIHKVS